MSTARPVAVVDREGATALVLGTEITEDVLRGIVVPATRIGTAAVPRGTAYPVMAGPLSRYANELTVRESMAGPATLRRFT
jgi:hypothetical protein